MLTPFSLLIFIAVRVGSIRLLSNGVNWRDWRKEMIFHGCHNCVPNCVQEQINPFTNGESPIPKSCPEVAQERKEFSYKVDQTGHSVSQPIASKDTCEKSEEEKLEWPTHIELMVKYLKHQS
ncbi:hypothetical protein XPA_010216 [Xanthoria parietina]